jgi:hypothetical protein
VIPNVARHHGPDVMRTITISNNTYRELITALPKGSIVHCPSGDCVTVIDSAQVFAVNVSGQQHQLALLAVKLLIVALMGIRRWP